MGLGIEVEGILHRIRGRRNGRLQRVEAQLIYAHRTRQRVLLHRGNRILGTEQDSCLRTAKQLIAGGYDDIGAGAQLGLDIWFFWQRRVMGEQAGAQVHDESRIVLHR